MSLEYLLLIVATLILGLGSQALINHAYKKWSAVPASSGYSGAEAARRMLDENGLGDVRIACISGNLTDNYDPRTNTLNLSQAIYNGRNVASTAVACHEAGHAIQKATAYAPMRFRSALVPVVNFVSNVWVFILIIGVMLNILGLVYLAIAFYAVAVLFQLVTLPVEFNASGRALTCLSSSGLLSVDEMAGARKVLTAAAWTYVSATLASILQLLYLLGVNRD